MSYVSTSFEVLGINSGKEDVYKFVGVYLIHSKRLNILNKHCLQFDIGVKKMRTFLEGNPYIITSRNLNFQLRIIMMCCL